jgi:hypothetical protein
MEGILLAIDDYGVAGISASIESGTVVVLLGQDVNQLSLALIPPLRTDDGANSALKFCRYFESFT